MSDRTPVVNVFENCNEQYVVQQISFVSFVISDFNKYYSLELKKFDSRFDSKNFERKLPIRGSLLTGKHLKPCIYTCTRHRTLGFVWSDFVMNESCLK